MIRAYVLLASAAVALRETSDDTVRTVDTVAFPVDRPAQADGLHTQELATSELRPAMTAPGVPSKAGVFGTSNAFVQLLTMKVPHMHLATFNDLNRKTFATQKKNEPGLLFSKALANEYQPNLITIAQVFNDSDAYIKHSKTESLERWFETVKKIGADLLRADVLGDPGNATSVIKALEVPRQIWPEFAGFASAPRSHQSEEPEDEAWLLEYKFTVPDENLTRFHVIDAPNMASFSDWNQGRFLHSASSSDAEGDDKDELTLFHAIEGYTTMPGFKQLAGNESAAYWSKKTVEHGMKVELFNVYGASTNEARELMKFLGNATFWEPISGFARY